MDPSQYGKNGSGVDPMSHYFQNNSQILNNDNIIHTVVQLLSQALFNQGLLFKIKDKYIKPTGVFKKMIDQYWETFLYKAIRFYMCEGFVVYCVRRARITKYGETYNDTSDGDTDDDDDSDDEADVDGDEDDDQYLYPDVPDPTQLSVKINYGKTSGKSIIRPRWVNQEIKKKLYILEYGGALNISQTFSSSPIDSVKMLLLSIYQLRENRLSTGRLVSQPPIIVENETANGGAGARAQRDDLDLEDQLTNYRLTGSMLVGMDTLMLSRIQRTQNAYMGQTARENVSQQVAPHMRIINNNVRRPEYIPIPDGMRSAAVPMNHNDLNYNETHRQLVSEIFTSFGIPFELYVKVREGKHDDKPRLNKDMSVNTMQAYGKFFSALLTSAFSTIYVTLPRERQVTRKNTQSVQKKTDEKTTLEKTIEQIVNPETNSSAQENNEIVISLMSVALVDATTAFELYEKGVITLETFQLTHPTIEFAEDDNQGQSEPSSAKKRKTADTSKKRKTDDIKKIKRVN